VLNHGGIIIGFAKGEIHLCVVIVEHVDTSLESVCVCVSVSYAQHHEACGEFHTFLTFVLDGSDLSLSCAIRFILSERALDAHRKGG